MANKEHLEVIERATNIWNHDEATEIWNKWRSEHPQVMPDISGVNIAGAELDGANFRDVNLSGADLGGAELNGANLSHAKLYDTDFSTAYLDGANLSNAFLHGANLTNADLIDATLDHVQAYSVDFARANLSGASLRYSKLDSADFSRANLTGTNLYQADLSYANLIGAELKGADFSQAEINRTIFADNDLREVKGLERVRHRGPSEVSISTIYKSGGQIPESFLRGCGVPDVFIMQIPTLIKTIRTMQPIQFYSCFISYSNKDEEFARRLHSRMRKEHLRVWFAPEDIKGGEKLNEQIDHAIHVHDRLLLVLSENSIRSEWVMSEIRKAREAEVEEKRRKLFPIRLVDYDTLRAWKCFDSDHAKDLAVEVREYFIPDFSNWRENDAFEASFDKLLHDLKAEESKSGRT